MYPHCSFRSRLRAWFLLTPILLVIRAVAGLPAPAAAPLGERFAVRQWHVPDGLPNEEVVQVAQDAGGFLWVASTGGVARFDGTAF